MINQLVIFLKSVSKLYFEDRIFDSFEFEIYCLLNFIFRFLAETENRNLIFLNHKNKPRPLLFIIYVKEVVKRNIN
jgi:hypothetical protein